MIDQKKSDHNMQALIAAVCEQTKAISAFSFAVMELANAINRLINEDDSEGPQTDLSGRNVL